MIISTKTILLFGILEIILLSVGLFGFWVWRSSEEEQQLAVPMPIEQVKIPE